MTHYAPVDDNIQDDEKLAEYFGQVPEQGEIGSLFLVGIGFFLGMVFAASICLGAR